MHDNMKNPFDPKFYQHAFDTFDSIADEQERRDDRIAEGYRFPDPDGARSSEDYKNAVTTNSFQQEALKESLFKIYENSSHKVIASNHDTVGFYQWKGHMSDLVYSPNTDICELHLPSTEILVEPTHRDRFKLSQWYRKWVKVEDLMNNWDAFQFTILLFIDRRVYSEYEMYFDDQEVFIRFKYNAYWKNQNHPIYVYKIPTNAQCRIKISRELCDNQWDWKLPTSFIPEKRILNSKNVVIAINRIGDSSIRKDGKSKIEVLGDNIEFLPIEENGYIDLHQLSNFNKSYIRSEYEDWIWMSIFVPKYFFEYPILNTVDSIYKSYKPKLYPVVTREFDDIVKHVYANHNQESKQIFIDWKNDMFKAYNGWDRMIRPIVLSDAYEKQSSEKSDELVAELKALRDLTIVAADHVETFRFYIKESQELSKDKVRDDLDALTKDYESVYNAYRRFLKTRGMEEFDEYEELFHKTYQQAVVEIKEAMRDTQWIYPDRLWQESFWKVTSRLITIPRELADRYISLEIISGMDRILLRKTDDLTGTIRFQRPIEERDFWVFEYDVDDRCWRPSEIKIEHHFPDVYLLDDPNTDVLESNRIFKTFFFYSDTMNVLGETIPSIHASPSWDDDMRTYYFEHRASYRDIFMEKFYWMGLRSIYKGVLLSSYKWELIEYVANNPSFDRFNTLFLKTMDPYFKMGLATYLSSNDHGFPFDYDIHKLEESMHQTYLDYHRITNFEIYLEQSWIPSYFDHLSKIVDGWNPGIRLIRRPPSTFDLRRLQPALYDIQKTIVDTTQDVLDDLDWVLGKLSTEPYNLNVSVIRSFRTMITTLLKDFQFNFDFIADMDLNIVSIHDINKLIANLNAYFLSAGMLSETLKGLRQHVTAEDIWLNKRETLTRVRNHINSLQKYIDRIATLQQSFDMEDFMRSINDLRSYLDHAKTNPDDKSLIGQINRFDDPWTISIKEARNKLFVSTTKLYAFYNAKKSYTSDEVTDFVKLVDVVKEDISSFKKEIKEFWRVTQLTKDQDIVDRLDHITDRMNNFRATLLTYYAVRNELRLRINETKQFFDLMDRYTLRTKEIAYRDAIKNYMDRVLQHMSYIVGMNRKVEAERVIQASLHTLDLWNAFNQLEQDVFERLLSVVKEPSRFIDAIYGCIDQLKALISYMETVNELYVPDQKNPTYSSVYQINDVALERNGFQYNVDDLIFVPKVGCYKVTVIEGKLAHVKSIKPYKVRTTTFRDPMSQESPYHTVSSSNGVGLTIRAVSSKEQKIINDDAVVPYLKRISNVVVNIKGFLLTSNPYNNHEYEIILSKIEEIQQEWNTLLSIYKDHISENSQWKMNSLMKTSSSIIEPSRAFMENRKRINPQPFFDSLENLLSSVASYVEETNKNTETFSYYDEQMRIAYAQLNTFIGTGSTWSDEEDLKTVLFTCKGNLKTYQSMIITKFPDEAKDRFNKICVKLFQDIRNITEAIDASYRFKTPIQSVYKFIEEDLKSIRLTQQKDVWYRIDRIRPAKQGKGYRMGDILEIVPNMDDSRYKTLSSEMREVIQNDKIYVQVSEMQEQRVTKIRPLLNYALPYILWGIRELTSVTGNGTGLTADFFSHQVGLEDSVLLRDPNSYNPPDQFYQDNDLIAYEFENIHDINISYDVFIGGEQTKNFHQRHHVKENQLHPRKHDVIYLNANDVMKLSTKSIHIPGANYFIYKVNSIDIQNHGAGYAVGQTIYVPANGATVKLRVAELIPSPYKGIAKVALEESAIVYGDINPSIKNTTVSFDDMNNIDDEFHVGAYDQITLDGVKKAATLSYPQSEYEYVSKRLDKLNEDLRNDHYMYRDVKMIDVDPPANQGDYEYHWYLGSRIDNSQVPLKDSHIWNGIRNIIPPTDPFLPDIRRLPPDQPIKGEYQSIGHVKMHSKVEVNMYMTAKDDHAILPYYGGDVKFDFGFRYMKLNANHFTYKDGIVGLNFDFLRATNADVSSLFFGNIFPMQRIEDPSPISIPLSNVIFDDRYFMKDSEGHLYLNLKYIMAMDDRIIRLFNPDVVLKMDSFEEDHTIMSIMRLQFNGEHFDEKDSIISLNLKRLLLNENEHEDYQKKPVGRMIVPQTMSSDGGSVSISVELDHYRRFTPIRFVAPYVDGVHSQHSLIPATGGSYNFHISFKLHKEDIVYGDKSVLSHDELPIHIKEWPEAMIGKTIIVEHDERFRNHRMKYVVRSFMISGFIIYHEPEYVDMRWNELQVDWTTADYRPDLPGYIVQYPSAPWRDDTLAWRDIRSNIADGTYQRFIDEPKLHYGTYIHQMKRDDISIFNWTTRQWEDLSDRRKWQLELFHPVRSDEVNNARLNGNHFVETPRGVELNLEYLVATIRDIRSLFGKDIRIIKLPTANPFPMNAGVKFNSEHFKQIGDLITLNLPNIMAFNIEIENLFGKGIHIDRSFDPVQFKNIVEFDQDYFMIDEDEIISLNLVKLAGNSTPIKRSIKYGFRLTYHELGFHSYDMEVFLNKIPRTQNKNAVLKRNAIMDISAHIVGEVNRKPITYHVNTGNHVRIRKIFPYEQREQYQIGGKSGYIMNFRLAPYIHFKNQILLQDIKIFNRTAERFEDLLDPQRFEVRFKDKTQTNHGFETNTRMISYVLGDLGEEFFDGPAWGWNEEMQVHLFGEVISDIHTGQIRSFRPIHCPNPPTVDVTLEFILYQSEQQTSQQSGSVLIEFKTERTEVYGDGYLHKVTNPFAPVPEEIQIIAQFDLDRPYDYDVIIDKTYRQINFIEDKWLSTPTFRIPKRNVPNNRLYVLTEKGRLPLINPSTRKPTLISKEDEYGTSVTFLGLYRPYQELTIVTTPYTMHSVYTQRRIPSHGYINLYGKINKPLNRNYFEFWVNGKLLSDEVTIISPTKIFLHGLTSLKNFELIEINRDPNEYFSNGFLHVKYSKDRPRKYWDYNTYIDAALEGTLSEDNYTLAEQESLLTPIWKQVDPTHPSFKDYPPNTDTDEDILQTTYVFDQPKVEGGGSSFQYMMIDPPTLEGEPFVGRNMRFEQFGFMPITNDMIIELLNEEWAEEIKNNPYFHKHIVIDDEQWYGAVSRMYTVSGEYTDTLENTAYHTYDDAVLHINSKTKRSEIIREKKTYDLT